MSPIAIIFLNFPIPASSPALTPTNLDANRLVWPIARLIGDAFANMSNLAYAALFLPLLLPASSAYAFYRVFTGNDWIRAVKAC
jgi:hypothetical protein